MAAVAMTALALVVANQGEEPAGATAALQLAVTSSAFQWPGRGAALGHRAVLALVAATRWWSVGRCRVGFEAFPGDGEVPAARGTVIDKADRLVRGARRKASVFFGCEVESRYNLGGASAKPSRDFWWGQAR